MIDARPSRIPALCSALLLVVVACGDKDTSRATPARSAAGAPANREAIEPSAEVVIAAPRGAYAVAAVANPGSVSGTITSSGDIAPGAAHSTGPDSGLCGASIPDESVVHQGNALGGVVVWLDGVRRGNALPLDRRIELESDHCRLTPRVQAAVVSSAVNVVGHDDFRQHLRFLAGGEREPRAAVLLGRDEQVIPTDLPFKAPGLVVVRDLDHSWPRAYLAVFDHPYFAVTAPNGTFTIAGVPPGKYTLRAWHERAKPVEQSVDVAAGGAADVKLALQGR